MPGKSCVFTVRVEPVSSPCSTLPEGIAENLVETPGTAPGSATLIPHNVYRHSQGLRPKQGNI
jgi:hypothetical protein